MDIWTENLLGILESIEGNGRFLATGQVPLILPGLIVDGVGQLPLPVPPNIAKNLIAQAQVAPFGRGSKTIIDHTVRKTWEIDASAISFHNPSWPDILANILHLVQQGLGLTHRDIQAHLYKLLIYEEGGFFLPHKDSEKEKGMFGTLVIGLPSAHAGGTLHVNFGESKEVVDFASALASYQLPFAAFYADCEHEIKPVTEGYRLCLVYNLVQGPGESIPSPDINQQVDELTNLIKEKRHGGDYPKAILLEHEYTPANFSRDSLKLHDRFRAEALLKAAEAAGFMAQLGLVTYYQEGDLEVNGYYDDYYRGDPNEGNMGNEIYRETTSITHWAKDGPSLNEISLSLAQVVSYEEIGEGDPTEKQGEGYTGNAGMTMEYWYHYGAVIFWPRELHPQLTQNLSADAKMSWIRHDLAQGMSVQALEADLEAMVDKIEANLRAPYASPEGAVDWSTLVKIVPQVVDHPAAFHRLAEVLHTGLPYLSLSQLETLMHQLSAEQIQTILNGAGESKSPEQLAFLMALMIANVEDPHLGPVLWAFSANLPHYLHQANLHNLKQSRYQTGESARQIAIKQCLQHSFTMAAMQEQNAEWIATMTQALHRPRDRDQAYLERYLLPTLIDKSLPSSSLATALRAQVAERFEKEAGRKPVSPADWRMVVPEASSETGRKILNMLRPFLESPTEQIFRYQKSQQNRDLVAKTLRNHPLDLRFETERKGSPHILKIIKARSEYDRAMRNWQANQEWLERLRGE
ncbi:MAG: 2OG-Fe(II) oxygenase [Bacteroidota bacterium]